jgi:multidrug transporter EmrE-like cation transporter
MSTGFLFGLLMATIDAFMLSLMKALNLGWIKDFGWFRGIRWMVLPTLIYALQPWIFFKSLTFESMTVMNLLWDVISDLLVTIVGLYYFKEELSPRKMAGVFMSFIAMCLLGGC